MSVKPCNLPIPNYLKHPFVDRECVDRLVKEYKKYGNLIVAFDFDNTIFDYHNNGGDYSEVINLLKECSNMHFTIVLFTNDDGSRLSFKKEYCKHFGINVDYINESPVLHNQGKIYYNILLDDRAGLESAYYILLRTINCIKNENNQSSTPREK